MQTSNRFLSTAASSRKALALLCLLYAATVSATAAAVGEQVTTSATSATQKRSPPATDGGTKAAYRAAASRPAAAATALRSASAHPSASADAAAVHACTTERQVVHCSHIAQARQRKLCCQLYAPVPDTDSHQRIGADLAAVAQSEAVALARTTRRVDLHHTTRPMFEDLHPDCFVPVQLPSIPANQSNPVEISTQYAPKLSTADIRRIKAHALEQLPASMRARIADLQWVHHNSGFTHPASLAGPAELVLMQQRLQNRQQPQLAAQRALLSGGGVRPKYYTVPETGRRWAVPTDCPVAGYRGPYAVKEVQIDWGGVDAKPLQQRACAQSFDPNAPQQLCGHISFVELDAVMAYKQAVAWWATGDRRHAETALDIVAAWSGNDTRWGVRTRNGPLEGGWGVAGMARALELLKPEVPPGLIPQFLRWVNTQLMPQMDYFVTESDLGALHSNFHAAIVDAMAAVAVLSNDRVRWDKAREVFDVTVRRYLRWGKDEWAVDHVLGECTETQRDIFHSQMGLAGLIQAAEMAFQQDEDWYSSDSYSLAAAIELHARIVRAALEKDEGMLPKGFKFFKNMPKPLNGTFWKFDLDRQIWAAHNSSTGLRVIDKDQDNFKYMVGTDYLPAGWELAYNHYANRLGLQMPETAALLRRMWPEWYELYFGLGTLTHGHTAADLWVPGIRAGFKEC